MEQKRQLTQWKKTDPELKAVHSQVTQDVVKRLHNSWESFKQRGHGFPRFKKYGRSLTKFGGTETDTANFALPILFVSSIQKITHYWQTNQTPHHGMGRH